MKNKLRFMLSMLAVVSTFGIVGSINAGVLAGQPTASIDRNAVLADGAVCTVVFKTNVEAYQALGAGNPIDSLVTMPATCTGNTLTQSHINGGVHQMLISGFRLIGVSHQVTTLATSPSGKVELLISAMVALERPTSVILNSR